MAGVTADAFDGIATISGSSGNDEIIIAPMTQREEVHVFDKEECITAWPQSDLREINVWSFEGDDLIRVADPVTVPVKTTGGQGTDTLLVRDPRASRRGWVFDVEQAVTESAFVTFLTGGHANHAGYGAALPTIALSPIPSDHLHVKPTPSAGVVNEPGINNAGESRETVAVREPAANNPPTNAIEAARETPILREPDPTTIGTNPVQERTGIASESSETISYSSIAITAHAGHDALGISLGFTPTKHGEHGRLEASGDPSSHAGHGSYTGSAGPSSRGDHGQHNASTEHSPQAGHGQHETSLFHSSHFGHSHHSGCDNESSDGDRDDISSPDDSSDAGHDEHKPSDDCHDRSPSSSDSSDAGYQDHIASPGEPSDADRDGNAASPDGPPGADGDRRGATPDSAKHGGNSGASQSHIGRTGTEVIVQELDAATEKAAHAGQGTGEATQAEIGPTNALPPLSQVPASEALGFLFAVRRWQSSTRQNRRDERMVRFTFEQLDKRGAAGF